MSELGYDPIEHDHRAFLERAAQREDFRKEYDALNFEYEIARRMLEARYRAGLTQDAVARRMGTSKSAVSRLESAGKHAPSLTTLQRYAEAVGCDLLIKFVPHSEK